MIVGPDFIWLHFPKCAGTSVERALGKLYGNRDDVEFDAVGPAAPMIWHDTIPQRMKRNPSFEIGGRRIISCIRRLPSWILSRTHFEAARSPHPISRDMIVTGRFHEQSGFINHADMYVRIYDNPAVDQWVRIEKLVEDFASAFGITENDAAELLPHSNKTGYSDAMSEDEVAVLYASCPAWSALERRVYG